MIRKAIAQSKNAITSDRGFNRNSNRKSTKFSKHPDGSGKIDTRRFCKSRF